MSELRARWDSIRARIEQAARNAKRDAAEVGLLAVSKTHSADRIEELYRLGQRDFGENYVQELLEKAVELKERGCQDIRWHFIGHLQTNKVKTLVPWVYAVHSVDSPRLLEELAKRANPSRLNDPIRIFIEVNIDQEPTKSGVAPSDIAPLVERFQSPTPGLLLEGLMAIPKPVASGVPSEAFRALRKLSAEVLPTQGSKRLSMGMSEDFEGAVAEGSHWVRVGTALFGPRKPLS